MNYETENWPFIRARHFKDVPTGERSVRVIVVHCMEAPEGPQTAENVARYFASTPTVASAHVNVDSDSVVQSVRDSDVAYAAPGANHDGIQVELAGYARQSLKEWMDDYGVQLLNRAAHVVAQYCLKYAIPPLKLTDSMLKAGQRGIVGHDQVSRVFNKSTHTDPGPNFPWLYFMCAVRTYVEIRK